MGRPAYMAVVVEAGELDGARDAIEAIVDVHLANGWQLQGGMSFLMKNIEVGEWFWISQAMFHPDYDPDAPAVMSL